MIGTKLLFYKKAFFIVLYTISKKRFNGFSARDAAESRPEGAATVMSMDRHFQNWKQNSKEGWVGIFDAFENQI